MTTTFPSTDAFIALQMKHAKGEITKTELCNAQWKLAVELGIKTRDEMMDDYATWPFTVSCGKFEEFDGQLEENCKYSEAFVCLEDAIQEHAKNKSYPWNRITIRDGDFIYEIEPTRMFRKRECSDGKQRYEPCDFDGSFFNAEG